ncbi:MAG: redoxin domain-containing protein [Planctomycetaceae bacterium]|nr:redoxin domain-containing protein [Planctomycetaceae bacterium]
MAAEQTVSIGNSGEFELKELAEDQYWCVAVRAPQAGIVFRQFVLEHGETKTLNVDLKPASTAYITIHDDQGKPLAGAKFRFMEFVEGNEGSFSIRRGSEQALGIPVAVSDQEGRLPLPLLSEGVVFKRGWVDHPNFAAVTLSPDMVLQSQEIAVAEFKRGFPVHFDIHDVKTGVTPSTLAEVSVNLRHNEITDAASVLDIPFSVSNSGFDIQLTEGQYKFFRITSTSHVLLPVVGLDPSSRIRIAQGENDRWLFRALPKVLVAGRVIDSNGKPVANASLTGEVRNVLFDGSPAPTTWGSWAHVEWGKTNAEGEYKVSLAPGSGRITYRGKGIPSIDHLAVNVEGLLEQRVPDIIVRDVPMIRGIVLDMEGQPASSVIVRVHSNSSMRYVAQPVVTGIDGEFEIPLDALPVSYDTEERVYEHSVFAFMPDQSVGGVTRIDLRNSEAVAKLRILMTPQKADWPLSEMSDGFTAWERGVAESRPDKQVRLNEENAAGSSVPELDGSLWLNTDKRSLKDFSGQFVLLDFYTTWCGPCAQDFPTVKMVHDSMSHLGATVIAVHDNSSPHALIRQHAEQKGMEMPIVVDHADGRLLKAFESRGLVRGYPGYVLIGPDGRLLASDDTIPAPLLRVYKVEIVRQHLLQSRLNSGAETSSKQ